MSARPVRRSRRSRLLAAPSTPPPRYSLAALRFPNAAPDNPASDPRSHPLRAALCDRLSHSPLVATAPGSRTPKAPCTPVSSPLNIVATRCCLIPRCTPHKPPAACPSHLLAPPP